jgi:Flp pilus assembly secretin CpaC
MFVALAGVVALAGNAMAGSAPVQQIAVAAAANAAAPVKPIAKPEQKAPAKKPAQEAAATKPVQKPDVQKPEAQKPPVHKMAVREVPVHKPAVPMQGVSVMMDDVALVSFQKPVATVYVGNASIAELTMVDAQHVFVLGKRFGATNLIALGPDKTVIANDPVTVSSRHADAITVFRGADTYNYSCTGYHCETRPVPGDPKNYFDNTEGPAGEHEDAGTKAASAGGGASQTH